MGVLAEIDEELQRLPLHDDALATAPELEARRVELELAEDPMRVLGGGAR
jgi:hypothetical protein